MYNDEDYSGSYFKLDPEFMNADYCSVFELYAILKDKNTKLTKISNPHIDQIFNKTLQYVERFNKFGFTETSDRAASKAVELRKILNATRKNFTEVEKSQIMNLLPHKAEEAMTLIPSLRDKFPKGEEEELQYYLDQLHKMASSITYDNA